MPTGQWTVLSQKLVRWRPRNPGPPGLSGKFLDESAFKGSLAGKTKDKARENLSSVFWGSLRLIPQLWDLHRPLSLLGWGRNLHDTPGTLNGRGCPLPGLRRKPSRECPDPEDACCRSAGRSDSCAPLGPALPHGEDWDLLLAGVRLSCIFFLSFFFLKT